MARVKLLLDLWYFYFLKYRPAVKTFFVVIKFLLEIYTTNIFFKLYTEKYFARFLLVMVLQTGFLKQKQKTAKFKYVNVSCMKHLFIFYF